MKKGFTLVELSIVLVIIGILMGMTVKGKSLIESARIKSDMATVNKLRTAVAAYAANADARFPDSFNQDRLINGEYLTTRDLELKYGTTALTAQQAIINNANNATTGVPTTAGFFNATTTGGNIVAVMGAQESDRRLGCLMDASIDDGMSGAGDIRNWTSAGNGTVQTGDSCKITPIPNTVAARYAVLVF